MKFAKLQSGEGMEALLRALEAPAVQKVAQGKLSVDGILGMQDAETQAAFQLIRWPDSKGAPVCPRCGSADTYTHTSTIRSLWRCAQCRSDFSVTSGTMLASRKMPLRSYLCLLSILLDRTQFRSLLQFSKETGIGWKSAWAQTRRLQVATEADGGCTVPFSILERAAFLKRFAEIKNRLGRFSAKTSDLSYPYLTEDRMNLDGAELLAFVNKLIPAGIPDYMRADMCQDLIVAVLSGEVTRDKLKTESRSAISRVYQQSPWKYKWMSFDAPLGEGGKGTLHDLMSEDMARDALSAGL